MKSTSTTTNLRTYTELSTMPTFNERFAYLKLTGTVGKDTFGWDRYLNQNFYRSAQWKHVRDIVIVRDNGCDLGVPELPIHGKVIIHHMNPITLQDFENDNLDFMMDPEYLICVSHATHNAIHYSDEKQLLQDYVPRRPNDTMPWKQGHLYVVCGLIGSGKTTYAKSLQGELVDYDYIGSKIKQVKRALELINQGKDVAYVTCLPTRYELVHLLRVLEKDLITYIWINTPEEICHDNIISRGRQRDIDNLEKVLSTNQNLLARKEMSSVPWEYV